MFWSIQINNGIRKLRLGSVMLNSILNEFRTIYKSVYEDTNERVVLY